MDLLIEHINGVLMGMDELEREGKMNDVLWNKRLVYQEMLKVIDGIY